MNTNKFEPLTRETLLAKGSCCGSGCQNCPYSPKHVKHVTTIKIENSALSKK